MGPISKRRGERGITHSELITRSKSLIYRSVKEEGAKGAARFMGSTDKKWFARWFVRTLMETETALQAGGRRKFLSGRAAAFCGESFHHFDTSEWIRDAERRAVVKSGSLRLHSGGLRFRRPPPWRQNTCRSLPPSPSPPGAPYLRR